MLSTECPTASLVLLFWSIIKHQACPEQHMVYNPKPVFSLGNRNICLSQKAKTTIISWGSHCGRQVSVADSSHGFNAVLARWPQRSRTKSEGRSSWKRFLTLLLLFVLHGWNLNETFNVCSTRVAVLHRCKSNGQENKEAGTSMHRYKGQILLSVTHWAIRAWCYWMLFQKKSLLVSRVITIYIYVRRMSSWSFCMTRLTMWWQSLLQHVQFRLQTLLYNRGLFRTSVTQTATRHPSCLQPHNNSLKKPR